MQENTIGQYDYYRQHGNQDFTCFIDFQFVCSNPSDRCNVVAETFPALTFCDSPLLFVNKFKYLGHIIDHSFSDDSDINREIRTLFTRTNVLCRHFKRCSLAVKVKTFSYLLRVFL